MHVPAQPLGVLGREVMQLNERRTTSLASDAADTFGVAHEAVLRFWFPPLCGSDHATMASQFDWWFGGGADAAIVDRFVPLARRAARGELDAWSQTPRGRLALIILLDQFSRSIHKGSAAAYAQDGKALALALEGIECGHYALLQGPWEKTFFFLPLGHCERVEHHEQAVRLAEQLAAEGPLELRRVLQHSVSQARGHRDVIARFGRHPHRNPIVGRPSTPDELAYLARGEFVHQRAMRR